MLKTHDLTWMRYVGDGIADVNMRKSFDPDKEVYKPPRLLTSMGFLFSAYKDKYWFWELMEIYRRITMTAVLTIIFNGSTIQIIYSMIICLVFIRLYNIFEPFLSRSENVMAELTQYQMVVTYLGGYIIRVQGFQGFEIGYSILDVAMVTMSLLVVVIVIMRGV